MSRNKTSTPRFPPTDSPSRSAPRPGGWRGGPATRAALFPVIPALALVFAAGCSEDPPPPEETPPDLTGTYELVSLKQGTFPPVGPPNATGTFTVRQTEVMGQEASGTVVLKVAIANPPITIEDTGTYKNHHDGSWAQSGNLQTRGRYMLAGDTLTVMVTEPMTAVSTTVWKR